MNNVKKPEPLCYRKEEYEDGVLIDVEYNGSDSFSGGRSGGIPLVPVAQVEAYKDACVGEALEQAASICDRFADRGMHPAECAGAIRALIPKQ